MSVLTPAVTDTNWHHIVATDDGATVKIYLDGVLKASTSTTLQLTPNTNPLNLGRANSNAYFFNGWLDEVAIYPTAFSTATVQAHYTKGTSDLVPPCFNLTTPANGSTFTDSAAVNFTGTAGAATGDSSTVSISVYSGESATGTPVQTLSATRQANNSYAVSTAVADGTWTAQAQQSNSGGTTAFSAANTFSVHTVGPPAPTIDSGPADPTNSANASFGFSDSEIGVSFRCSLDDTAFADCTSPQSYTGLADGSHRFRVKAVDTVGNEGAAASYTWRVDTTPPAVTLTSPTNGDSRGVWPMFRGIGGTAAGDSPTVAVNLYAGSSASGTPLQTMFATLGTGGAYAVIAGAPLGPGTYTAQAQQSDSLGNPGSSAANTFTVGDPVLFAAGSIAGCNDSGASRTAALLSTAPDALVLTLGNAAYPSGQPSDYQDCFDPTWGVAKARTRPVLGGHDLLTVSGGPPPGTGYVNYFASQLAPLGASASDLTKLYYSYDLGAWHVVALNDFCIDGTMPNCDEAAQEQWLRNDLAAHTNQCVVALSNRPRWNSDSQNGNRLASSAFWNIFYQYGVDLVLNGATHHYERFAPQDPDGNYDPAYGIREIISGHGGLDSIPMGTQQPNSLVYDDSSYGVLKLTLHSTSYDWQFLPVADGRNPAGGSFTDSGSGSCHGVPSAQAMPYRDQVVAGSPVSYWRLGETSGATAADELGANPGTYSNVLLNQAGALAGDSNPSASFDGVQSYVRVPSSASLSMTSAVTVEFWAKRRTISSTYQVLVGKPGEGQSKNENYAVWLGPSNRYTAYFGDRSTWVAVQTPAITDTNWHYVVATNDGSTVKIYLDGALKQSTSTTLRLTANTLPLNIGRANNNRYFFNGLLDEAAIYPTALSATTVQAHYNRAIG